MINHDQTVAISLGTQWIFYNIHYHQFSWAVSDNRLKWSSFCMNRVFPFLTWQTVSAPIIYFQRHGWPEKPLSDPCTRLGCSKLTQVIVHHLKHSRFKTPRDNYLTCFRILSAYVPEDAVLPNAQVWHLLVKELEVLVLILIHNLWRGFFRYQQGLDLTQNWATVVLSFDQVKGPCFLNISLHSLDST